MSGNLVEVILRLRDEASGALRQVAQAAEQARQRIGSLSDNLAQVSHGLQGLSSSLGAILGTAGLTYALKSAADTAFQTKAAMQSLSVAAAQAGTSLEEVLGTLDPLLDRLGILPEQASGAMVMLLRAGLSVEQIAQAFEAGAASALAAGKTAAEGIENVAMALSTGQSIYLNYIGIAENIGPVLQKVASSMKGASEEAIRQAQVQAALNVILRATGGEVAALPAFLEGYAAAQNRLNASLYEFRTAIGNAVLPYLTALYDLLAESVEWFNSLNDSTKRAIGTGAVAAAGILGFGTAMGLLLPVIQNAITVFQGLAGALLALAANPVTLAIAGAAYIAVAWAKSAETVEESRKRFALLGQTLMGLYDLIKGVFQSIVGLLSSVGQIFATIARAFMRVVQGDFRGAWEEVQKGLNLEIFAAKFEAANQSLVRGWSLLGQTLRGEVSESAMSAVRRVEELVDRVNASLEVARKANNAQIDLGKSTKGTATAFSEVANAVESASGKVSHLTDAVDALRKRHELGDLTLAQYLQSLQALLSKWEPHLQGLKVGTDEWKRYADAVLAAKRAMRDATTAASRMARTEQERRAPRDWSGVMTGPEVVGVEGWRDAILDTIRLGSTAYGQLMDQISALEARLARGGLSAQAEAELKALLEVAQRTAREWEGEILKALEGESEERLAAARSLGQSLGEELAQGIETGLTSTQLDIIAKLREELETQKIDLRSALEADLAQLQVSLRLGDIAPEEYAARLRETIDTYRSVLADFYRSGEVDAQAFNQLSDQLDRLQREWEELVLTAREAAPEWETSSSSFLTFLQSIPDQAEGTLRVVRELVREMGPGELQGVIAANIAYLQELQAQVPSAAREYQILSNAIGELRVMYLDLFPVVQSAGEEIQTQAEDYYDVAGGASAYAEEVRNLLDQLREGTLSQEQFNEALARLREDLASILPVWEAWLKSQEEAGVSTEEARKALAQLQQALAKVGVEVQEVSRQRLSAWASGLARDIQTAADAMFGLMDAFSAPSFGQGLAAFARGVGGIVSLIPGLGPAVGSLVSAVGGILGSVVGGILNMLDSGLDEVQARIHQAAGRFKLISEEAFQSAVETYQESYLFGLIRVTKYRINEALIESMQAIAGALEGGVLSGVRNAAKAFLRGAQNWAEALRTGIREAIANAVIEAVIQGAVIKGALGKLLDELTAVLAKGDYAGARAVAERIMAAIPAVQAGLENVLAPFRGFLGGGNEAVGSTQAIRYELPTVTMASPSWVSEMGDYVAEFGAWVQELTTRGVRVRVERESWAVLAAAIGG